MQRETETIKHLSTRVGVMESGATSHTTGMATASEKSMIFSVFDGDVEGWRVWRGDVSDFMDTRNAGMQRLLQEISMNKESTVTESLKMMSSLSERVLGGFRPGLESLERARKWGGPHRRL